MHQSHFQCFKVIQNAKYLQLYSNPKHSCLSRVPLSFSCLSCTYPRRRLELLDACGRFSLTLQTDRTHITQVLSQITRSPSFFHSTEQTYLGELQWSSKVLISAWPCSSGSDSTLYAWLAIYKFWDLLVETCFNCGVTHCASEGPWTWTSLCFPKGWLVGRNCTIVRFPMLPDIKDKIIPLPSLVPGEVHQDSRHVWNDAVSAIAPSPWWPLCVLLGGHHRRCEYLQTALIISNQEWKQYRTN